MLRNPNDYISERELQASVIEYANLLGYLVFHAHDSRREIVDAQGQSRLIGDEKMKGFPDLVLARPPRLIFAELKAEVGKLSRDQFVWRTVLEACSRPQYCGGCGAIFDGMVEYYLWYPSSWPVIEATLTREK